MQKDKTYRQTDKLTHTERQTTLWLIRFPKTVTIITTTMVITRIIMIAKNDNSNKNNNDNNNNSNNNIERGKVTLLSRITINVNLEIHLERPVKKLLRPSA